MSTASSLKSEGNAHFAAKRWADAAASYTDAIRLEKDDTALSALLSNRSATYLHLGQPDKALEDASLAVLKRPTWGKAHARVAEVHSRLQDFQMAELAYTRAIDLAEDAPSKTRYEASLSATKSSASASVAAAKRFGVGLQTGTPADMYPNRIRQLNVPIWPGSGLALTMHAYENCEQGMKDLDDAMEKIDENGNLHAKAFSLAMANICECILADEVGFMMTSGKDPKFPLPDKLSKIAKFELFAGNATKYFTNAIWSAKDIIDDLDKRIATDGQTRVRQVTSSLIRGKILAGFVQSGQGEHGSAVADVKLAMGLLEDGSKKWARKALEDKGKAFQPTFLRIVRAYLLNRMQGATRDAKTPSARRMFTLEAVETMAKEQLEENNPANWPAFDGSLTRLSYYVKPRWEAYTALAWVHSQRARKPLANFNIPSGQARMADLDEAKKAAECYDKATELMPDDFHRKREMLWHGLEMHLRAGGQTIQALYSKAEKAEKVNAEMDKIFGPVKDFEQRIFARHQVQSIRDTLASMPPGQGSVNDVVKAIPTLNLQGTPPGFAPQSAFAPGYFERLPGSVCVVDVLGLQR